MTCSMTVLHAVADVVALKACHALLIVHKLKQTSLKVSHDTGPCIDNHCASSIDKCLPAIGLLLAARWRKQVRLNASR